MACVSATVIVSSSQTQINTPAAAVITVTGLAGIRGPAGGQFIYIPSAASLSGHRAVKILNGVAYYCDGSNGLDTGLAVGITCCANDSNDPTRIQLFGEHNETSWSWADGPVYVGVAGLLTQSLDNLEFLQQIGIATSATQLIINPQPAIRRQ